LGKDNLQLGSHDKMIVRAQGGVSYYVGHIALMPHWTSLAYVEQLMELTSWE